MATSAGAAAALSLASAPAAAQQAGVGDQPAGPVRLVGHTGITVSDLDRSIRFYRDVLGCQISRTIRAEGPNFEAITGVPGCKIDIAFARLPGHIIELLCYREPLGKVSTLRPNDPGFTHLCLKVDDLGRVTQQVLAAGFEVMGTTLRDGAPSPVYVRDPDGVVLELMQYAPGTQMEERYFL
ncbi:MAG: VOC family protein [Pseudomonadales bacterium]|nr:VOC family protein [Pseudomonadales bacterium]